MKSVLLFFLMIAAAVVLGLVIAYWYLRRLDNRVRLRNAPRTVPLPEKHPPVDLTPTSPDLLEHRADATGTTEGANVDGLMRRLGGSGPDSEPPTSHDTSSQQPSPAGSSPDLHRDDLKRISGIGPKLERLLHDNGIVKFDQIAGWQDADIRAIDQLLPAFHGRIEREDWVGQARRLRAASE